MKTMKIDDFNDYSDRIYRLLNIFEDFEDALQCETTKNTSLAEMFCIELKFMSKFLISSGKICVKFTKYLIALERTLKRFLFLKNLMQKKKVFKEKLVAFLYSNIIPFCMTDKVQGIPISQKFIANTIGMFDNTRCIHHSHVTGHIIGYAHTVCNERVRENYYKIPVIAQRTACFVLISFSQQKV